MINIGWVEFIGDSEILEEIITFIVITGDNGSICVTTDVNDRFWILHFISLMVSWRRARSWTNWGSCPAVVR